jgi:hypothetical protein
MASRDFLNFIVDNTTQPLQIAEVGVKYGANAMEMLSLFAIEKLFLIDPYKEYLINDSSIPEPYLVTQSEMDRIMEIMLDAVKGYKDKVTVIRCESVPASRFFPNRSLDCVYIDANHQRPYIDQDLMAWYPKIKKNGILAGHDYKIQSVQEAVDEFIFKFGIKQSVCNHDWIIVK